MAKRASPKRYAQAVFELALAEGRLDPWAEDLHQINLALAVEDFKVFLQHAKVPPTQKVRAIKNVLPEISQPARNLISLMVSRGLVELVPTVEDEYLRLLNKQRGVEQVKVWSAVPLKNQEKESIDRFAQRITNKNVVLETIVDPAILGGLILKVGDKLLDGSTKTKLQGMRKKLQATSVGSKS